MAKPDTPPGQAQVLHIQNTDPTKPVWEGTKAEYNANKKELKEQGYVLADDAPNSPPAPTPS